MYHVGKFVLRLVPAAYEYHGEIQRRRQREWKFVSPRADIERGQTSLSLVESV